jgi:hypothetical protein
MEQKQKRPSQCKLIDKVPFSYLRSTRLLGCFKFVCFNLLVGHVWEQFGLNLLGLGLNRASLGLQLDLIAVGSRFRRSKPSGDTAHI